LIAIVLAALAFTIIRTGNSKRGKNQGGCYYSEDLAAGGSLVASAVMRSEARGEAGAAHFSK
jgi:hypothetical protein